MKNETIWAIAAPAVFFGVFFAGLWLGDSIKEGAGPWLAICFIATPFAIFWWIAKYQGADLPWLIVVVQAIFLAMVYAMTGFKLFA
jgi:hypothetical protein